MKKLWKRVVIALVGIFVVCVLFAGFVFIRAAAPSYELENQLHKLIAGHDKSLIQKVSVDDATAQFLLNASAKAPISASDFQGGGSPRPGIIIGYIPASIGNQFINCYMVLDNRSFSLIPHWKLVKVSLKPVGIDPSWAQ